ncbi:MAG TPA: multiheme c-type cytochrome [Hyphomicrobiaceae bacterium]|nr:multiheme c-type cytochrome [Hyphomicrobiaceae bacterium]
MLRAFILGTVIALFTGAVAFGQTKLDANEGYVGSPACAKCHMAQHAAWLKSHHANAWNLPNANTVLGDFSGATFTHNGVETHFIKKLEDYLIKTEGADGKNHEYKVQATAGITPLQQYLIETEPGRLQAFDVAWDVNGKRWYHLFPDQKASASDGLHWTGPYKNWNGRCAACHATHYKKTYDPRSRKFASTQAEIGVGCEACHGPGQRHIDWAQKQNASATASEPADIATKGLIPNFSSRSPQTEIQQCAGCHSRREALSDASPAPGTPYNDAYAIALLRPDLYHHDGAIKDEDYVYGSFLQSKMHRQGVRCSNCHDVHSGAVKAEGNALCTQCHSPAGNASFPTLTKKDYDTPDHHFHQAGTDGALCKSCHMMERTYMGVDRRRDHSFRVPRPDLSAAIGVPNTCNDCHGDKSASWAAAELEKRFPNSRYRGAHFGTVFKAATRDLPGSVDALLAIASDKTQAPIVRASALDKLKGVASADIAGRSQALLKDEDPMVRAAAAELQRGLPPGERLPVLEELLSDQFRTVRIAAARTLLGAVGATATPAARTAYTKANGEFMHALMSRADFPETHMALGGLALQLRNMPSALAAFHEAVGQDPQLVAGWVMLVRIELALGRDGEALKLLRQARQANQGNDELEQMEMSLTGKRN